MLECRSDQAYSTLAMGIVFADIERLALSLHERQRARLADALLRSLSEDFIDEDEIAEAIRRDREMDEHPEMAISLEELDRRMADRFAQ